ncbi:hypothetical protein LHJ74_14520 [Streptomyces sp. N2-109]|uniref:Uncharacterized protein n=1 Tax=Streptomyces gossypii TaxID=2883101 RepID=A0ABT2JTU1_9ACTN|nr:hypothetical protein [Streptomyces gossypii]MCT2591108.1 hypothetical protein [Streptomyces gossypii]
MDQPDQPARYSVRVALASPVRDNPREQEQLLDRFAAEVRAAALEEAANYVRGVWSGDEQLGRISVSTALCFVSDRLRDLAAAARPDTTGGTP